VALHTPRTPWGGGCDSMKPPHGTSALRMCSGDPTVPQLRRYLASFGWCGILAGVAWLLIASAGPKIAAAQGTPSPSPVPTPVALDISTTLSRQTVARREAIDVFIIVTNKSATEIQDLKVSISNNDFSAKNLPTFPALLPVRRALRPSKPTSRLSSSSSKSYSRLRMHGRIRANWSTRFKGRLPRSR
jgi:hypothetical protein